MDAWQQLGDLPAGVVFETRDGTRAVKSQYRRTTVHGNGPSACIILGTGEYADFQDGDQTEVRSVIGIVAQAMTTLMPIVPEYDGSQPQDFDGMCVAIAAAFGVLKYERDQWEATAMRCHDEQVQLRAQRQQAEQERDHAVEREQIATAAYERQQRMQREHEALLQAANERALQAENALSQVRGLWGRNR